MQVKLKVIHRFLSLVCLVSLLAGTLPYSPRGPAIPSAQAANLELRLADADPGGNGFPGSLSIMNGEPSNQVQPVSGTADPGTESDSSQPLAAGDIESSLALVVDENLAGIVPGKSARLAVQKGALTVDFPAGSAAQAIAVSLGRFHRAADRPLPDGLRMSYFFTLEGSVFGTGQRVAQLDRDYDLSLSLDAQAIPADAALYRWDAQTLAWVKLAATVFSGSLYAKSNRLTDFAAGSAQPAGASSTLSPSTQDSGYTQSFGFSATSGSFSLTGDSDIPYVGGYLGVTTGAHQGRVAARVVTDTWQLSHPGDMGPLVKQLVRSQDGTFYAVDTGGSLRRSEDAASWKTVYSGSGVTGLVDGMATLSNTHMRIKLRVNKEKSFW